MKFKSILFILLILIPGFFMYTGLKVNRVDCFTQYGECAEEYRDNLKFLINRPIFKNIPANQVITQFPSSGNIKSLKIYRRLPSTVVITLTLRQPVGYITNQVLGSVDGFDETGKIFPIEKTGSLPLLIASADYSAGDSITDKVFKAAEMLVKISSLTPEQITGYFSGQELRVKINDTDIILDPESSPNNWFSSLHSILNRSKMLDKLPKKVDMRYSQPVVTF